MTPSQANDPFNERPIKTSGNMIVTNQSRVTCNGGGGPLGHPQIWLTVGPDGRVICPYCSRVFVKPAD